MTAETKTATMGCKNRNDAQVGDKVVIVQYQRRLAVSEIVKVNTKSLNVRRPTGNGTAPLRFKTADGRIMGEATGYRNGGPYANTHITVFANPEDAAIVQEEIAQANAEVQRKKNELAAKKKEAQDAKDKERRELVEAYWVYEGRKLWVTAPEVPTAVGKCKVLSFRNRDGELVAAMVHHWEAKDKWAIWEPQKEKVYQYAAVSGMRQRPDDRERGPDSYSSSTIKADDVKEMVYDIVH